MPIHKMKNKLDKLIDHDFISPVIMKTYASLTQVIEIVMKNIVVNSEKKLLMVSLLCNNGLYYRIVWLFLWFA